MNREAINLSHHHSLDLELLRFVSRLDANLRKSEREKIIELVTSGANVNGVIDGETPLMWAILNDNYDAACLLIQLGADSNRNGRSANDLAQKRLCTRSQDGGSQDDEDHYDDDPFEEMDDFDDFVDGLYVEDEDEDEDDDEDVEDDRRTLSTTDGLTQDPMHLLNAPKEMAVISKIKSKPTPTPTPTQSATDKQCRNGYLCRDRRDNHLKMFSHPPRGTKCHYGSRCTLRDATHRDAYTH